MDLTVIDSEKRKESKDKLIEFMDKNNIEYTLSECCGNYRICIEFSGEENACKNRCRKSDIVVQTIDKDVFRVYPDDIIYIAIEGRKSVLYLTDKKLETNYRLEHWTGILDPEIFAQPHHSFIVNLNYVQEVTKEWVKVRHEDKVYSVYTSTRKIGAFKKAFLNFGKL